jgi:hypothetical protein
MRTPEELKESLNACFVKKSCAGCNYPRSIIGFKCIVDMCKDALTYIEQLEEKIDLMLIQMHGDCGLCKHKDEMGARCAECVTSKKDRPNWEYEGLPEVKSKCR